jgi:hypothetical protein
LAAELGSWSEDFQNATRARREMQLPAGTAGALLLRLAALAEAMQGPAAALTVTQALRELLKLGIVRETAGRARGRIFAYARYLDALNAVNDATTPLTGVQNGVHTRALVRCYKTACFSQMARSAVVTGTRAARSAGSRPPNIPIPKAHATPVAASEGVTAS